MTEGTNSRLKFIESFAKETRYFIIECSVFIEEKVSDTLGRILDIDWKKSESLGYGSSTLSFNNKVQLIQDLKGLEKQVRSKFQTFMTIRNKFAHLNNIDSFYSYFENIKSSKDRKNELHKWYPKLNRENKNVEQLYKQAYLLLTLDLFKQLFLYDLKHAIEKGKEIGSTRVIEKLLEELEKQLIKTESGKQIWQDAIDRISREVTNNP